MLGRSRWPMWAGVLGWIVIGYSLPAIVGTICGVRDPNDLMVHDEFCYLLQADTFASGRLTNPSPAHPEFFESPHILVSPSYQSKYLPAQGAVMALGQRLFGHPICGIWLSCGFFAGALYWMLSGWVNRTWAAIGTLHGVGILGVTTYWAQGYWGGMVSAVGGTLVLGGTIWTLRQWRPVYGFWTAAGAVILMCSRPFEGVMICAACAPVLAMWLWSGSTTDRLTKLAGWLGPFAAVMALGGGVLATYNQAVTGNWKSLPYAVHTRQYFTCGLFRWQPLDQVPERRLETRVRDYYEGDDISRPGRPGGPKTGLNPILESVFGAIFKLPGQFGVNFRFLGKSKPFWSAKRVLEIVITATYLIYISWSLWETRHWGRLRAAHLLLVLNALIGATVWWKALHYRAPFCCLYYFLAADLFRRVAMIAHRRWPGLRMHQWSAGFAAALAVAIPFSWVIWGSDVTWPGTEPEPKKKVVVSEAERGLTRAELLKQLSAGSQPALAFVSYDPKVSVHEEWVYNRADLATARVVLAHDMGTERNQLLIGDFPQREVWRVRVTEAGAHVERYAE